jgi:hypothetical protein
MFFPPPPDVMCPTLPITQVLKRFEVTPQTSASVTVALPQGFQTSDLRLVLFAVSVVAANQQWVPVSWPTPEPCVVSVQGRCVPSAAFPRSITRSSAVRTLSPVDITGYVATAGGAVSLIINSESRTWSAAVAVCLCRAVPLQHVIDESTRRARDRIQTSKSSAVPQPATAAVSLAFSESSSSAASEVDLDAGWQSLSSGDDTDSRDAKAANGVAASPGDEDLCTAGAVEVSLRCPLSYCKMAVPARGPLCEHDAAFDLATYVTQAVATSTWNCPVCDARALWSELVLCPRLLSVLSALQDVDAGECDRVRMLADGRWTRLGEKVDHLSGAARKRSRSPGSSAPTIVDVDDDD